MNVNLKSNGVQTDMVQTQAANAKLESAVLRMLVDTDSPLWRSYFDAWLFLAMDRSSDAEVAEYKTLQTEGRGEELWQRISSKVSEQDERNIVNIVASKFAEVVTQAGRGGHE